MQFTDKENTLRDERQVNKMAYGYQRPDPDELFRSWMHEQKRYIDMLEQEGFTIDQAIELLKVRCLGYMESIADGVYLIN